MTTPTTPTLPNLNHAAQPVNATRDYAQELDTLLQALDSFHFMFANDLHGQPTQPSETYWVTTVVPLMIKYQEMLDWPSQPTTTPTRRA